MNDDRHLAVMWAREHWHLAIFACACLPIIAAFLVYVDVVSERAAWAATAAGIVYILLTTWLYTRRQKPPKAPSH